MLATSACGSLKFVPAPDPVTIKFRYMDNSIDYETLAEQFTKLTLYITIEILPITSRFNRSIQEQAGHRGCGASAGFLP